VDVEEDREVIMNLLERKKSYGALFNRSMITNYAIEKIYLNPIRYNEVWQQKKCFVIISKMIIKILHLKHVIALDYQIDFIFFEL
jgi:hypothetical protein